MPEDFPFYATALVVVGVMFIADFRKGLVMLLKMLWQPLGSLASWLMIAHCRLSLWWWSAWGQQAYENHQGRIFYAAFGLEACHNPDEETKRRIRFRLLQATQLFNDIRHHPLGSGKSILTGLEYKLDKCIDEPKMNQLLTAAVTAAHHFGYISQSQAQWLHQHSTPTTEIEGDLFSLPHLVVDGSLIHQS